MVSEAATEGYLIKSAKSKIIDHYRKKSTTLSFSSMEIKEDQTNHEIHTVHNLAVQEHLEEDLEIIVDQLPPKCQEVYRLSREEYLTTNEIADQLGISQKTVKNHITKALSVIRHKMQLTSWLF